MKFFSHETRQKMSEAAKRRAASPEEKNRRSLAFRFDLPSDQISDKYRSGMTIAEIAAQFNVSQKAITNNLRRSGTQIRAAVPRTQKLENNPTWKGARASYTAFHQRLYRLYGKVQKCSVCGSEDPAKLYEWANLTGHYEDVTDYARMCRSCHRRYDGGKSNLGTRCNGPERKTHCLRGHEFTSENTGLYGVNRYCRECSRIRNRNSRRLARERQCG